MDVTWVVLSATTVDDILTHLVADFAGGGIDNTNLIPEKRKSALYRCRCRNVVLWFSSLVFFALLLSLCENSLL